VVHLRPVGPGEISLADQKIEEARHEIPVRYPALSSNRQ
jgi:hypothetical protein